MANGVAASIPPSRSARTRAANHYQVIPDAGVNDVIAGDVEDHVRSGCALDAVVYTMGGGRLSLPSTWVTAWFWPSWKVAPRHFASKARKSVM